MTKGFLLSILVAISLVAATLVYTNVDFKQGIVIKKNSFLKNDILIKKKSATQKSSLAKKNF